MYMYKQPVLLHVACAVAWVAAAAAAAGVCIPAPPDLTWTEGNRGYLEFTPHTIVLNSGTIQTRAWKDSASEREVLLPPPILRFKRGESYSIVVRNSLPEGPTSEEHNTLRDPNIFNLHTHGLHISGEMPADDVTRRIGFGECAEYVYHIPTEHLGGTHFYHPHHHGSTFLHIAGGAMGMIIVEDDEADLVPANVMAMTEQHVVLSRLDKGGSGAGGDTLFWNNGDGHTDFKGNKVWTVNGVEEGHGDICIPRNTWQRWRIMLFEHESLFVKFGLGAYNDRSGDSPFEGAPCEMQLMARDGIWRSVTPKTLDNGYFMPASTRVDIAIKCSGSASLSLAHSDRKGALSEYTYLANVVVDPSLDENAVVGPFSEGATGTTWTARKPDYAPGDIAAVSSAEIAHSEIYTVRLSSGFTVQDPAKRNPSKRADDPSQVYQRFDPSIANAHYSTDGVYEFNPLKSGDHSFHLHIWPLFAVSFLATGDSDCKLFDYEEGEYYDVWRCEGVARFKTVRFAGNVINHCHMVKHEDEGLMGWFNVSGTADQHEPNPCPQNNLYTCSDVYNGHTDADTCTATISAPPNKPNPAALKTSAATELIKAGAKTFKMDDVSNVKAGDVLTFGTGDNAEDGTVASVEAATDGGVANAAGIITQTGDGFSWSMSASGTAGDAVATIGGDAFQDIAIELSDTFTSVKFTGSLGSAHNFLIKDSNDNVVAGDTAKGGAFTFDWTPSADGVYTYYCAPHQGSMNGQITVTTCTASVRDCYARRSRRAATPGTVTLKKALKNEHAAGTAITWTPAVAPVSTPQPDVTTAGAGVPATAAQVSARTTAAVFAVALFMAAAVF